MRVEQIATCQPCPLSPSLHPSMHAARRRACTPVQTPCARSCGPGPAHLPCKEGSNCPVFNQRDTTLLLASSSMQLGGGCARRLQGLVPEALQPAGGCAGGQRGGCRQALPPRGAPLAPCQKVWPESQPCQEPASNAASLLLPAQPACVAWCCCPALHVQLDSLRLPLHPRRQCTRGCATCLSTTM